MSTRRAVVPFLTLPLPTSRARATALSITADCTPRALLREQGPSATSVSCSSRASARAACVRLAITRCHQRRRRLVRWAVTVAHFPVTLTVDGTSSASASLRWARAALLSRSLHRRHHHWPHPLHSHLHLHSQLHSHLHRIYLRRRRRRRRCHAAPRASWRLWTCRSRVLAQHRSMGAIQLSTALKRALRPSATAPLLAFAPPSMPSLSAERS